ncbi:hypothetical protein E5676_scaffold311G00580 [Cucumis melo var. makuwa]|uniref:Uncharacterized protein n=1 Tax=Cucumis melo var. makuwa TaxID=1194695 RepID=A0A5D3DGS1_CUCMM|nr:hypothetical protein E6C27_scaffold277G003400 [Cucumis melo var. makuwa]TYK22814.1 hypothetical protein E5676_scaffold311G00580 [Cucumis melo var. makuwa]
MSTATYSTGTRKARTSPSTTEERAKTATSTARKAATVCALERRAITSSSFETNNLLIEEMISVPPVGSLASHGTTSGAFSRHLGLSGKASRTPRLPKEGVRHNIFLLGGETIILPRLGLLQKISSSRDLLLPFHSLPQILDPSSIGRVISSLSHVKVLDFIRKFFAQGILN